MIFDIKEKVVNFLASAPDDFTNYLGGCNVDAVDALLDSHSFEDRLEFLGQKLEEMEAVHCTNSSSAFRKFIQKAYSEDPKKALDWFVLSDDSP